MNKELETLEKATRIARKVGHCKDAFFKGPSEAPSACCTFGILRLAQCGDANRTFGGSTTRLYDITNSANIADWNDRPTTTKDDVIQVLDANYVLALQEHGIEPEDVL